MEVFCDLWKCFVFVEVFCDWLKRFVLMSHRNYGIQIKKAFRYYQKHSVDRCDKHDFGLVQLP